MAAGDPFFFKGTSPTRDSGTDRSAADQCMLQARGVLDILQHPPQTNSEQRVGEAIKSLMALTKQLHAAKNSPSLTNAQKAGILGIIQGVGYILAGLAQFGIGGAFALPTFGLGAIPAVAGGAFTCKKGYEFIVAGRNKFLGRGPEVPGSPSAIEGELNDLERRIESAGKVVDFLMSPFTGAPTDSDSRQLEIDKLSMQFEDLGTDDENIEKTFSNENKLFTSSSEIKTTSSAQETGSIIASAMKEYQNLSRGAIHIAQSTTPSVGSSMQTTVVKKQSAAHAFFLADGKKVQCIEIKDEIRYSYLGTDGKRKDGKCTLKDLNLAPGYTLVALEAGLKQKVEAEIKRENSSRNTTSITSAIQRFFPSAPAPQPASTFLTTVPGYKK